MIPMMQLNTLNAVAAHGVRLSRLRLASAVAALALAAGNVAGGEDPTSRLTLRVLERQAPFPKILAAAAHDTKRNRLLVFGGSVRDNPEASAQILSLDLQTERWQRVTVDGPAPRGTSGPALVYIEDEDALYLFGGWPRNAQEPLAELWTLDLAAQGTPCWKLLSNGSHGPPPRNGCCMVADTKRKRLIVHGGDGGPHPEYGFKPLDDLWEFNLVAREWHQLNPTGDVPKPRWNHVAAIDQHNDVLFVFGGAGYVEHGPVLDREVFALDLKTLRWTRLPARGTPPPPVEGTTLTHDLHCNLLLVVGGMSVTPWGKAGSHSVWLFDLTTHAWIEYRQLLPTTRRDHVAVYDPVGQRHIVFGGDTVTGRDFYSRGADLTGVLAITVAAKGTK